MKGQKSLAVLLLWAVGTGFSAAQALESGMVGPSVEALQRLLTEVGYLGRSIDGEYGSTTKKAVELFQKHHDLPITGVADDATQAKIRAAVGTAGRDGGGVILTEGNRGNPVRMYQEKLVAAGVLSEADGVYGKTTSEAVLEYQARHGIPTSGIIDEETRDFLDKKRVYEDNSVLVEKAQARLVVLGYMADGMDGIFGEKTKAALKKFQKDEKLPETGRFDDTTLNRLYEEAAAKVEEDAEEEAEEAEDPTEPEEAAEPEEAESLESEDAWDSEDATVAETVSEGSKPKEVKRTEKTVAETDVTQVRKCQEKLIEMGYLKDKADGILGLKTAAALQAYQKDQGLPETGILDEETQEAMNREAKGEYRRGDRGDGVKRYQRRLAKAGYLTENPDGIFGAAMEGAVKDFQKDNDIPVTGRIDGKTRKELDTISVGNGELRVGDRGGKVARLQNLLTLHGFTPGTVDGVFGATTELQLRAFQHYRGIKETGIADDVVWECLEDDPIFQGKYKKKMTMHTTAYTPYDGGGQGHTALGNIAGKGHAAVDPGIIPLGSIIFIEGYGYALADDIGAVIQGNIVDVGVETLEQAYQWGSKDVTVYVVE